MAQESSTTRDEQIVPSDATKFLAQIGGNKFEVVLHDFVARKTLGLLSHSRSSHSCILPLSGHVSCKKVLILLGSKFIAEATFGNDDIGVGDDLVLGNVTLKATALGKTHGQEVPFLCHISVVIFTVTGVAANAVESFASLEVAFCQSENVGDRFPKWSSGGIVEERSPGDGRKHLYLRQMKRRVESVERPISHLKEIHVLALDRMIIV